MPSQTANLPLPQWSWCSQASFVADVLALSVSFTTGDLSMASASTIKRQEEWKVSRFPNHRSLPRTTADATSNRKIRTPTVAGLIDYKKIDKKKMKASRFLLRRSLSQTVTDAASNKKSKSTAHHCWTRLKKYRLELNEGKPFPIIIHRFADSADAGNRIRRNRARMRGKGMTGRSRQKEDGKGMTDVSRSRDSFGLSVLDANPGVSSFFPMPFTWTPRPPASWHLTLRILLPILWLPACLLLLLHLPSRWAQTYLPVGEEGRTSWKVMEPDGRFGLSDQVWPGGVSKLLETTHSGLY